MLMVLLFLALYYAIANSAYLVLLLGSMRLVRNNARDGLPDWTDPAWPRITVLMAAYNEQEVILRSTRSLLQNPYPNLELVIINDGSRDKTFDLLATHFHLSLLDKEGDRSVYQARDWPNLRIVDKPNSGKSQSLNSALDLCRGDYVITLDADTFVENNAFHQAVRMIESRPDCKAVGGTIRILNGAETDVYGVRRGHLPRGALSMFQIVEYIRAFFGGRLGWEHFGGTALLSGAFSLFRADALRAVGGFDAASVTEDLEIVIRLKHHFAVRGEPCSIHMFPAPACWTIVPETVRTLFWQRVRWQKGLLQTLWKHRRLICNPTLGRTGTLTLPYMLVFEALSPVVELVGYVAILTAIQQGLISISLVSAGIAVGLTLYTLMTLAAIRLEETHYARYDNKKPRLRFILFSGLEYFGYRQFLFVARLVGTLFALRANPSWAPQDRSRLEEMKVT